MDKIQVMRFEVISNTCKKKCFDIYQFSLGECFCWYSSMAIAFWKNYIFWGMCWNRRVGNPGPLITLPPCTWQLTRMGHISDILGFQLGQPMGLPTISLQWKIPLDWSVLWPKSLFPSKLSPLHDTFQSFSNCSFPLLSKLRSGNNSTIFLVLGYDTNFPKPHSHIWKWSLH